MKGNFTHSSCSFDSLANTPAGRNSIAFETNSLKKGVWFVNHRSHSSLKMCSYLQTQVSFYHCVLLLYLIVLCSLGYFWKILDKKNAISVTLSFLLHTCIHSLCMYHLELSKLFYWANVFEKEKFINKFKYYNIQLEC